jgi:hypothetical protein
MRYAALVWKGLWLQHKRSTVAVPGMEGHISKQPDAPVPSIGTEHAAHTLLQTFQHT